MSSPSPTVSSKVWVDPPAFPIAARAALRDSQLRHNLANATATIRGKRARVVAELPDWEQLRAAGAALKDDVLANLDRYLVQVEERVTSAGGHVHWARDADEANRIVIELVRATGVEEVVKVKSMATQEIELNEALAEAGIAALETDLAELIVQLGDDRPSHILVPAIHRNRAEIRELFLRTMPEAPPELTDEPRQLAMAARTHLRRKFLAAKVAISGANFVVAETGGPGPIGAILNPQLHGTASERDKSLPYASTLCGRCYEVCPVAIDIPEVLVHLRGTVVDDKRKAAADPEVLAMKAAAFVMASPFRFTAAENLMGRLGALVARRGYIGRLPGPLAAWTDARDAPAPPTQPFRTWWKQRSARGGQP